MSIGQNGLPNGPSAVKPFCTACSVTTVRVPDVAEVDGAGEAGDRGEQVGAVLREADRAVAAHRQAGDRAAVLRGDVRRLRVDPRDHLGEVEVRPALGAAATG